MTAQPAHRPAGGGSAAVRMRSLSKARWDSWWSIIRILPQAGRAATVATLRNLVIGVVPLGFVVATSAAIARVPELGRSTRDAWGPVLAAMTLAIVMLLLQSALSPFQAAFTELISRRVDGFCTRRLMRCTLAEAPVAQLEQADVLDKLSDARRGLVEYFVTPGAAAAGLVTLIARYAQLLGAVVIVGIVLGPLAAFLIAAAALVARCGNRGSLSRWSVIIDRLSPARRKMFYVFDTGSELAAAKEIRVLGTLPWWRARAEHESGAYPRDGHHRRDPHRSQPVFAFLPLCAVVPVLLERVAQTSVETAREQTAERLRLNKHLIDLATSIGAVRELRLFGSEHELLARQRSTWDAVTAAMWHGQLKAAAYRAIGQGFFALGYGGAILLELASALHQHASIGDLVLVITLAVQVSVQVSGALGLLSLLQTAGRTVDRIEALRSIAASVPRRPARAAVPSRLDRGITLEDVSFSYPGSAGPVLSGICLDIPAGQTLALVGENGAGKSTLVKLLCGLYLPTSGRDPGRWRGPGRHGPGAVAGPHRHALPGLHPDRTDPGREHRARRRRQDRGPGGRGRGRVAGTRRAGTPVRRRRPVPRLAR